MYRLASAVIGFVLAYAQPVMASQTELQGTWTATTAERDGKGADEVVGNRLSLAGDRFRIQSKDGKLLYAGTVWADPGAKPAAIDFAHKEGVLNGKVWKGIYAPRRRHAYNLRQRTDPGKGSAHDVRGKEWVRICPH